ncbi:MAG: hypothetical protein M1368_05435 [Thaumarchaeota archaeon]|nr:hypothetical protein [Nitrososphaerota archaeon]
MVDLQKQISLINKRLEKIEETLRMMGENSLTLKQHGLELQSIHRRLAKLETMVS